jgi:hypothetical protein
MHCCWDVAICKQCVWNWDFEPVGLVSYVPWQTNFFHTSTYFMGRYVGAFIFKVENSEGVSLPVDMV